MTRSNTILLLILLLAGCGTPASETKDEPGDTDTYTSDGLATDSDTFARGDTESTVDSSADTPSDRDADTDSETGTDSSTHTDSDIGTDSEIGSDSSTGTDSSDETDDDTETNEACDSPYGMNASDAAEQLDRVQADHFGWHRTGSMWTDIEWNHGWLDFSRELTKLTEHRARGLQILNQIVVSAPWSCRRCFTDDTVNCTDCKWWEVPAPVSDPRTSHVYHFVYELVTYLQTQFPDYHVSAFSAYNEIDQTWDLANRERSFYADYVEGYMQPLYLAVHDACRDAGVNDCVVLGPTLSTMDFEAHNGESHQALYELGAFDWIDIYDYHPYQGWWACNPTKLLEEVDREREWLLARGLDLPMWFSEIGISVCQDCGGKGNVEDARIEYLSEAMNLVKTRSFVRKVFIYNLVDRPGGCDTADNGWGLYDENLNPRPARDAISLLAAEATCPAN